MVIKSQKFKTPNINIAEYDTVLGSLISNMQQKKDFIINNLSSYNQATSGVFMEQCGQDYSGMIDFLLNDFQETPDELCLIRQTSTSKDVYTLSVFREEICNDSARYGIIITKETSSHELFCYHDENGWVRTSWEERYGCTYHQYLVLQEDTAEADVLEAILDVAQPTDEEFRCIIEENAPLLALYQSEWVLTLFDFDADTMTLRLIPSDPRIAGMAIICKDGKLVLERYIEKDIQEILGLVRTSLPAEFFDLHPIAEMTKTEAEEYISKYFYTDNPDDKIFINLPIDKETTTEMIINMDEAAECIS